MNKIVKKIIFLSIVIIGILGVVINVNKDIEDNIYVVSESERSDKNIESEDSEGNIEVELESKDFVKETTDNINKKQVTIYISGEVNSPGVVTLDSDMRLSDGVIEVGGMTENADLNNINLAIKIEDEKHYVIPKIGDINQSSEVVSDNDGTIAKANEGSELININDAKMEELDTLPGVGEATANKIINYREESGKFNSIEEIKNVNGIGDKKFEEIKELISIK